MEARSQDGAQSAVSIVYEADVPLGNGRPNKQMKTSSLPTRFKWWVMKDVRHVQNRTRDPYSPDLHPEQT